MMIFYFIIATSLQKNLKKLYTELSKYAFLKDDVFNTDKTKLFLNKIAVFLSKIKTEDELAHITKDNDKAKAQLQKALKIKKMNDEIISFNKIIDENIKI